MTSVKKVKGSGAFTMVCSESFWGQKRSPDLNWRSGLENEDMSWETFRKMQFTPRSSWEDFRFEAKDAESLIRYLGWGLQIFLLYKFFFRNLYNGVKQISHNQRTRVNGTYSFFFFFYHDYIETLQCLKKENSVLKCQPGLQQRLKFGYQERRSLN